MLTTGGDFLRRFDPILIDYAKKNSVIDTEFSGGYLESEENFDTRKHFPANSTKKYSLIQGVTKVKFHISSAGLINLD